MTVRTGAARTAVDVPVDDARALRRVLGRFATGVAVVTAMTPHGPRGMTVNSFASVSLDPPLVLFAAARSSSQHAAFARPGPFAVHVLAEEQRAVSARFAAPGLDRFDGQEFVPGEDGTPLLPAALAVLECRSEQVVRAGDHDIVVGRVGRATRAVDGPAVRPLLYYGGSYRKVSDEWDEDDGDIDWSPLLL
ncbi:flavin reductase family protein [Streptomyces coelicoflavus]|uniref:flavin reductase family protein n=1 Tax=Streptomyces coelicoflavus TaxID=285562 RepID=UPI0036BF8DB4